jgi:hypothetical protein
MLLELRRLSFVKVDRMQNNVSQFLQTLQEQNLEIWFGSVLDLNVYLRL